MYTREYQDKIILNAFEHFEKLRVETHGDMCSLKTYPIGKDGKYIGCPFGIGLNDCSRCVMVEAAERFKSLLETEFKSKLSTADRIAIVREIEKRKDEERAIRISSHCRDCEYFTPNKPNGSRCYKNTCSKNPARINTCPSSAICRMFKIKESGE